jgi:hypothetical protein
VKRGGAEIRPGNREHFEAELPRPPRKPLVNSDNWPVILLDLLLFERQRGYQRNIETALNAHAVLYVLSLDQHMSFRRTNKEHAHPKKESIGWPFLPTAAHPLDAAAHREPIQHAAHRCGIMERLRCF